MAFIAASTRTTMSDDQEELLKILEAQGQQFLQSFSLPQALGSGKTRASTSKNELVESDGDSDSEEEEWGGVGLSSGSDDGSSDDGEGDRSGMTQNSSL